MYSSKKNNFSSSQTYKPTFKNAISKIAQYRWSPGLWAWIFHRVSGLALVGYLVVHIIGLRVLYDPVKFDELITLYRSPLFKIGEFLVLIAVTYHAINGFRIVAVDFLGWSPKQKKLLYATIILSALIIILGGYPIIAPYFIAPFFN